jgi:hypothetical protein
MNLPQTQQSPDDPERLPPARRRRARRLLAPLEADDRAAVVDEMAHRISPTVDFFIFSLISGLVIGLGLLLDAPSLMVLGALLAPLMSPVIGLAFGTVIGSSRFFGQSLISLLLGGALVLGTGALAGIVAQAWLPSQLIQARYFAQLSWPNFIVLVLGMLLSAFTLARSDRQPLLTSAAIAYELYVPLVVAGFGLTSGVADLWPDGLVIFALYLAWGALVGAISFAILGFRPLTLFGYTLGGAVTLLGVILLIGISGAGVVVGAQMAIPTQIPTLTFTPTPVPPTPTRTLTPVPPTATLTITPSLTPSITPSITPSPTATPVYAFVYAPSGDPPGAKLRREPGGTVIRSYLNYTLLQILPETEEVDGLIWVHVIVVEDGTEGWLLQSLVLVATPAPNWEP